MPLLSWLGVIFGFFLLWGTVATEPVMSLIMLGLLVVAPLGVYITLAYMAQKSNGAGLAWVFGLLTLIGGIWATISIGPGMVNYDSSGLGLLFVGVLMVVLTCYLATVIDI